MVVYQFSCAGCNFWYIGETSRQFSTRIKEHTVSDKNSHIFKHFSQFPSCKSMYTPCFRMMDSANSSIDLKLKEAFYISKNNLTLTNSYIILILNSLISILLYCNVFRHIVNNLFMFLYL